MLFVGGCTDNQRSIVRIQAYPCTRNIRFRVRSPDLAPAIYLWHDGISICLGRSTSACWRTMIRHSTERCSPHFSKGKESGRVLSSEEQSTITHNNFCYSDL
ncbi:hypothetical protein Trydic_g5447 [Trypoxylus dichotomus]